MVLQVSVGDCFRQCEFTPKTRSGTLDTSKMYAYIAKMLGHEVDTSLFQEKEDFDDDEPPADYNPDDIDGDGDGDEDYADEEYGSKDEEDDHYWHEDDSEDTALLHGDL